MRRSKDKLTSGEDLFVGIDLHKNRWHVTIRTVDLELFSASIPGTGYTFFNYPGKFYLFSLYRNIKLIILGRSPQGSLEPIHGFPPPYSDIQIIPGIFNRLVLTAESGAL